MARVRIGFLNTGAGPFYGVVVNGASLVDCVVSHLVFESEPEAIKAAAKRNRHPNSALCGFQHSVMKVTAAPFTRERWAIVKEAD